MTRLRIDPTMIDEYADFEPIVRRRPDGWNGAGERHRVKVKGKRLSRRRRKERTRA